ncbi:MAG: hypothetical protein IKR59_01150 [Lachnospiraceae bacterium]|nr:hypothetical protein [Lachnospiraceae bacterium]
MNKENALDVMEQIDAAMIDEADTYQVKKRKNNWVLWAAIAACLFLAAAGTVIRQKAAAPEKAEPGIVLTKDGVTIPKKEVSLSKAAGEADMIGFFIYQGHCYIQYEWIENADLVGEYLGTATGLIDEWTPKKGYVELAGSVKGDFFTVKGCDPSFMLCMKDPAGVVCTYVCDNGITLKYGRELYEDRLNLSGNYTAVQYETRESWYKSRNELYEMTGNEEAVRSFIHALDEAEFLPGSSAAAKEGLSDSAFYETEIYHLYFKMANGMTVHLRLYENGYVRFQGLMDLCVQMPEKEFGELVSLMENRTNAEFVSETDDLGRKYEKCANDPELGAYIPAYGVPETELTAAEVRYYLEPQTGAELGTKEIILEYAGTKNHALFYAVTITWKDEYGVNGWGGPMLDCSELSTEALAEHVRTKGTSKVKTINVGVWYGDVSAVLSAGGLDAEEAYRIFSSVQR